MFKGIRWSDNSSGEVPQFTEITYNEVGTASSAFIPMTSSAPNLSFVNNYIRESYKILPDNKQYTHQDFWAQPVFIYITLFIVGRIRRRLYKR